jgi:sodium-dependent dicarboxylate transporter 2/3/5
MAVWWVSEALPMPATALVPIALFPLLGVMKTSQVTAAYSNHLIYLFMGGFLIAVTMEKWQLHRRIALHVIRLVGVSPERIIFGFMLATALLSMWISNTATAMMMLTIGLAVLHQAQEIAKPFEKAEASILASFGTALVLGIAYGASIGGVATLIGTPPNAILAGVVEKTYGISIGFAEWMLFALPLSLLMFVLTWTYLTRVVYCGGMDELPGGRHMIESELQRLGPMKKTERRVLLVFCTVACAWVLRSLINIDALAWVTDSSIAILGALALFAIPADFRQREFLLDWNTAVKIPWDIIILFGGGFALAEGFNHSGLTGWLAVQLVAFQNVELLILVAMVVLLVLFLTELTSNTATASLFLPVMGALGMAIGIHPLVLMVGVAIAASYAFMLPVATPPNAIVFASRAVTIPQMARAGLILNLAGVILITLFVVYLLPVLFGIDIHRLPEIITG